VQGIWRLFRCLCNPAYDVDDDFEPPKWVLEPNTNRCVQMFVTFFFQVYDSEPCEFRSYVAILYLKDTHADATSALVNTMTVQISGFPFSLPRTVALLFPPFFWNRFSSVVLCLCNLLLLMLSKKEKRTRLCKNPFSDPKMIWYIQVC